MNKKKTIVKSLLFAFALIIFLQTGLSALTYNNLMYWSLDDSDLSASNPIDIASYLYNGTTTGATTGQAGLINEAFDFNATNDMIEESTSGLLDVQPLVGFSVNMWVNADSCAAGNNDNLMQKININNEDRFAVGITNTSCHLYFMTEENNNGVVFLYTPTPLSIGGWTMVTIIWDKTNGKQIYLNGTSIVNDTGETVLFRNGNAQDFTIGNNAGGGVGFDGQIDEVGYWNRTLTMAEMTELFNSGAGLQYPYTIAPTSDPIFLSPTPANDSTNNTQITINTSCADGNVYLWFNQSLVISNQSSPANYTTNISTSGTFEYIAACYNGSLTGFSNNVSRTWTYDIIYPAITINTNNAFNQYNYSQISQYLNIMILNLTFTDNIDLFAYSINITKNGGATILYNETNESISGTSYNYYKELNTSSWLSGWYDIEIKVADSHTQNKINDYIITKKKSSIIFKTENDNNIKIETDESSIINEQKEIDRYIFNVSFTDTEIKTRSFHIKSDKCPLIYRENSGYAGHFVSYCDGTGNWIDFEGVDSDYIITKKDNYHYIITFDNLQSNMQFKSIGGLNIITATNKWYKGTPTQTINAAGINETTTLYLSLSKDSTQDNFTANLVYNGTVYQKANLTDDGSTITINQSFTTPSNEGAYTFYWNITYNQTDTTSINFNITGQQNIFNWSLFNCTSGNISLIFNIFNEEKPANNISSALEIDIESWLTDPINSHSWFHIYEGKSSYRLCLYPAGEIQYINMYAKYTADNGFTHRYYLYNFSISNTTQNISMYNFNTTTLTSDLNLELRNFNTYQYFTSIIAKLQRRYVSEGVWRTVQMDKSGDFGTIFFNIKEENTDYRILYYDTSNHLLKETATLKFVCTSGICEIIQLIEPYDDSIAETDIIVTHPYNNITKILSVNWHDPQANNNNVEVRVSKETMTGQILLCNQYQTGASGTINCNLSGYSGDIFLTVLTSHSPYTPILSTLINIGRTSLFSLLSIAESVFWTFGIMITIIGFGLWSPVASIISAIFGLIALYYIGLFKPISLTFIIISIALSIIISIKVKK